MKTARISDFVGGWFVGDFSPSILTTQEFEVCVKHYCSGDREPAHFQHIAVEITAIISGSARMGQHILEGGDVIRLEPGEVADFEALTDVVLVAVKSPSLPSDKEVCVA